jgi:hypothetical protein
MPEPTTTAIKDLAVIHILRYSSRLEQAKQGTPGYNLQDCRYYLGLWESIREKNYEWDDLSPEEQSEVRDAWEDENGPT